MITDELLVIFFGIFFIFYCFIASKFKNKYFITKDFQSLET